MNYKMMGRFIIDALFEIISGFTTTGSSVQARPEDLPDGILYWRGAACCDHDGAAQYPPCPD